jgi:hypothetical protein
MSTGFVGKQVLEDVLDWIHEHPQAWQDFESRFPALASAYLRDDRLSSVSADVPLKDTGLAEYLTVEQSMDPDYPGVDITMASKVIDKTDLVVTYPRVCIEQNTSTGQVRVLIWDDPLNEDYTREIPLSDSFSQYIQQGGLGR